MKILRAFLIAICLSGSAASVGSTLTEWNVNKFALSQKWLGHFFYNSRNVGFKSLIDSQPFFFTENGKNDPKAELLATIKELQKPDSISEKTYCRSISRFELVLDEFPELKKRNHCHAFENWIETLSISEIRLSFATGYIKNPASSFGHLFLKLVSNKSKSELLDYGVNFSAQTGTESGADYALKGLFGYYSGGFVFLPYYRLIKDYSDLEGRDIWELDLQMNKDEIRHVLAFLFEFDANSITYTFLNDNCAGLLERLIYSAKQTNSKDFSVNKPWKIPFESFQRIASTLTATRFHYQPSLKSVLSKWEKELSLLEKKSIALEKQTGDFTKLSSKELDFLLLDKKIQTPNPEANDYNLMLQHRAKLNEPSFESTTTSIALDSPLLSKPKSSLVSAALLGQELDLRMAVLNDQLIYDQGYSEINLFDVHFKTKDRLNLAFSEFGLFNFLAGEPVTFIRQPLSYGGGLAYLQDSGWKAEALIGLLYSKDSLRYFPKLQVKIKGGLGELGPEFEIYYLMSSIHFRAILAPNGSVFEIQKTWSHSYTTSLVASKDFKSTVPEWKFAFGQFF